MINITKSYLAPVLGLWPIAVFGTEDQMCPQAKLLQHPQPLLTAPCISLFHPLASQSLLRPTSPFVPSGPMSVSLRHQ